MEEFQQRLAGRLPSELLDLADSHDSRTDQRIGLLLAMLPPAHVSNRYTLFALLATKNLNLTLGHGNGPLAACVYVMFAIVARTLLKDSRLAREFSQLALVLNDRKGRAHTGLITFVDAWFINHWVSPVGHAIQSCEVGAVAAEQAGDVLYSCYAHATAVDLLAQTGRRSTRS